MSLSEQEHRRSFAFQVIRLGYNPHPELVDVKCAYRQRVMGREDVPEDKRRRLLDLVLSDLEYEQGIIDGIATEILSRNILSQPKRELLTAASPSFSWKPLPSEACLEMVSSHIGNLFALTRKPGNSGRINRVDLCFYNRLPWSDNTFPILMEIRSESVFPLGAGQSVFMEEKRQFVSFNPVGVHPVISQLFIQVGESYVPSCQEFK